MTIPQYLCLLSEKPPGHKSLDSAEAWAEFLVERAEKDEAWSEGRTL
jgi:hypothetical protein